jgi:hypothetical protein
MTEQGRNDGVGAQWLPPSLRGAAFSREEQRDVAGRGNPGACTKAAVDCFVPRNDGAGAQ